MPLYRLEPAPSFIDDEDWTASTHKAVVYVEAASEKQAREIAHRAFWIAASKKSNGEIPINPWKDTDKVLCQEVETVSEGILLLKAEDVP